MKRKFAFGLPPLKVPTRTDTKALKETLELNYSFYSPPESPVIDRPRISAKVVAELRDACTVIVEASMKGEAPDTTAQRSTKPPAAKSAPKNPKESLPKEEEEKKVYRNARPRAETDLQSIPVDNRKSDVLTGLNSAEIQANYARREIRRTAFPARSDSLRRPPPLRSTAPEAQTFSPIERPRTAPNDSSDGSFATPMSTSTDHQPNHESTAVTSLAMTPARTSKPGSTQIAADTETFQAVIDRADAQATEWMKQQKQKPHQVQEAEPAQPPPSRASGKGWSITSEVREYVRQRSSRSLSRERSRSRADSTPHRSSSAHGWRPWGLNRKSSKCSMLETVDMAVQTEPTKKPAKREIDLNRELPPLPSLDTYKENMNNETSAHIVSMIRPKSRGQTTGSVKSRATAPVRQNSDLQTDSQKSITSPSIAADTTEPIAPPPRKFSTHSKGSSQDSCFSPASSVGPERSIDLIKAAYMARSSESLRQQTINQQQLQRKDTLSPQQPSAGQQIPALATSPKPPISPNPLGSHPPMSPSLFHHSRTLSHNPQEFKSASTTTLPQRPATRSDSSKPTPNFSRKISIDTNGIAFDEEDGPAGDDERDDVVVITALPQMPPKRPTGLRRMLSSLSGKGRNKEKRDREREDLHWMGKMEKEGIKEGVIEEGAAEGPVVKY